ncbi:protein kinase-like protein [Xylariomycetidae sp. FL0641]|nr:protein kinase-like protein [Xylariomycetidae sp. FL0641]
MEELSLPASEPRQKPLLITSELLGLPPYAFDPEDLEESFNPLPGKDGNQFRQIDDDTLIKYGRAVTLAEAEAMDYISKHTSIKCPKVFGAYQLDKTGHIIMSFERGTPLPTFWKTATEEERETIIGTLKQYVSEMRSIKGDYVGGFNRSSCVSGEFEWDFHSRDYQYGPYPDEQGFNDGILDALARAHPGPLSTDPESSAYNNRFQTEQLVHSLRGHEIVFTHGDLHGGNILIRDDLSVVILDWYTAGFYPAYWEWYKATWHGTFMPSFIRQIIRYIPPYWIEAKIMQQIFDKIVG